MCSGGIYSVELALFRQCCGVGEVKRRDVLKAAFVSLLFPAALLPALSSQLWQFIWSELQLCQASGCSVCVSQPLTLVSRGHPQISLVDGTFSENNTIMLFTLVAVFCPFFLVLPFCQGLFPCSLIRCSGLSPTH